MFKKQPIRRAAIDGIKTTEGESIEKKVERMMNNRDVLEQSDRVPLLYTERKDGVQPQYDIRQTDKLEAALNATTIAGEVALAKRENKLKGLKGGKEEKPAEGGSTQATEGGEQTK